jgi:CheY-like chemotaxis protein
LAPDCHRFLEGLIGTSARRALLSHEPPSGQAEVPKAFDRDKQVICRYELEVGPQSTSCLTVGLPVLAEIPVVVTSADATLRQINSFKTAGAREYLTKPLDVQEHLRVIDDELEVVQKVA